MAVNLSLYEGREQSYIKHLFLTKYLQIAAFKILTSRSNTFNYVDAMAGPWQVPEDPNYAGSSFDLALNTLEEVRVALSRNGTPGLKIRFCFCERNAAEVAKLRAYASRQSKFEIHVFKGDFEDNLDAISRVLPDGFTFTFIDPKGWNLRFKEICAFLTNQRGEFLLNFMSDHINRHTEFEGVSDSFGRFVGNPNWKEDYDKLPAEWSNEQRILQLVKDMMIKIGAASYLPDFSIQLPRKERLKMRLLLGTHNPKGLEVFRDVQGKVELAQTELKGKIKTDDTLQVGLFAPKYSAELDQQRGGVGCQKYKEAAEALVLKSLELSSPIEFCDLAVKIMNEVPIRLTQIKRMLNEMKSRGEISFELPNRKRVPQPDTIIGLAD